MGYEGLCRWIFFQQYVFALIVGVFLRSFGFVWVCFILVPAVVFYRLLFYRWSARGGLWW